MTLLDEAIGHRQAQSSTFAFGLGREERLECLLQNLRCHAGAGVGHFQQDIIAGRHRITGAVLVEQGIGYFDCQPTAAIHRVTAVDGQVENHVFDLTWIGQRVPEAIRNGSLDFDQFAEGPPQ